MSWLTPFVIDARVGVTDPLELLKGVIICNDDSAFNLSRLLLLELDAKFESVKKDGVLAIATSGEGWMEHETNWLIGDWVVDITVGAPGTKDDPDATDVAGVAATGGERGGNCTWDCAGDDDEDETEVCGSPSSKLGVFALFLRDSVPLLLSSVASTSYFFFLPRFALGCGLVCIRLCLVSSSLRLNRLLQLGKSQTCGFSPVCVLMCLVWCSKRRNALWQIGQTCGLASSLPLFLLFFLCTAEDFTPDWSTLENSPFSLASTPWSVFFLVSIIL